jgi:hypothetical protein
LPGRNQFVYTHSFSFYQFCCEERRGNRSHLEVLFESLRGQLDTVMT